MWENEPLVIESLKKPQCVFRPAGGALLPLPAFNRNDMVVSPWMKASVHGSAFYLRRVLTF